MSVVIFQPSVAPFVQHAARALEEAGLLEHFYTTLIDDPSNGWQRLAIGAGKLLHRDPTARLRRRQITEVNREKVETFPFRELLRLAGGSLDRSGRLTDLLWEQSELSFARKVARRLNPNVKGLYGYEFSARAAFERARELGIKTFYDVPAPEPNFVENLLRRELERFPELQNAYSRHTAEREARRTAHRRAEWDAADRVIAASHFTEKSFASDGRDVSKIRIVPYGSPPPAPRAEALKRKNTGNPLRFVWAGTFGVRKGAHYLLEAWNRLQLGRHAILDVYGSVMLPAHLLTPLPPGIRFHGPIDRATLFNNFQNADALVFPTLCDGFGMVVTEAWSQGLPVILTDRAGASDLLCPGENGFSVAPGDADALGQTLESLIAKPSVLASMRESALGTAAAWQWSDYRRALVEIVLSDLQLKS